MSAARDMRRCALQALYQFDAGNESIELVRESLVHSTASERDRDLGLELALAAWAMREEADAAVSRLTPDWPTYRQPVVDRSVLRLAYCEMVTGRTPPKVAINEAVELAREFSTEKSPLFINGVLDKIYKSLPAQSLDAEPHSIEPDPIEPDPIDADPIDPESGPAGAAAAPKATTAGEPPASGA